MKKNLICWIALLMALASCSKEETTPSQTDIDERAVQFSASINGGAQTRFSNAGALSGQAFSAGDKFYVGIKNNDGGPTNFSETKCFRTITVGEGPTFSPDAPLYWNDLGGRGTNAYIWGVYIHGTNNARTSQAIDKDGKFTWTVEADQTGILDFQLLDLLYSDNKTSLVYTPDANAPKKRDTADLTFNHAMSRIMINVKAGEGFAASEFTNATATLDKQFLAMDMDLLGHTYKHAATPEAADVKMCKKTTTTEGYTATFDAIVAADKTYAAGDLIATLVINNNTYQLTATADFITALGTSKALQMGKYYTFNVQLSKQGIQFTATITDWANGYETPAGSYEAGQIVIDTDNKGVTSPQGTNVPNNFGLFQSTDGKAYDSDATADGVNPSTNCTYNKETGEWEYDPTLYWQGAGDDEYFRGFYAGDDVTPTFTKDGDKNTAVIAAGTTDYQWGTSGADKVSPTSGAVQMQFTHTMSQVTMNLISTDGEDKVDLTNAEVRIVGGYINGTIDLHTGTITLVTQDDLLLDRNTENTLQHTKFVMPQTLGNDVWVTVTVNADDINNKNVYKFQLNKAVAKINDVNQAIDAWKPSTRYTYKIKIKKKVIDLTAQIVDWNEAFNNESDFEIHL